jgi:hypothetical protein
MSHLHLNIFPIVLPAAEISVGVHGVNTPCSKAPCRGRRIVSRLPAMDLLARLIHSSAQTWKRFCGSPTPDRSQKRKQIWNGIMCFIIVTKSDQFL